MKKKLASTPHADGENVADADLGARACLKAVRALQRGRYALDALPPCAGEPFVGLGRELQRLGRSLERRFQEIERLRAMGENVAGGQQLDDTLDRIHESFRGLIPYNRIGCALLSADGHLVQSCWARSDRQQKIDKGYTAPLAGSSLESLLRSGQPRILNDLPRYLAEHPTSVSTRLIVEEGMRSSLTCPLQVQGKTVGFLFFSSRRRNTYREHHPGLFQQIAGQLSALLERSRLYQQVLDLNRELVATQKKLRYQATRDELTGLYNRRAILEFAEAELQRARRRDSNLAVVLADIDHFKRINDQYGHLAGDTVLRAIASALARALRAYDRIGRYGGEEFLAIVVDPDGESTRRTLERLRESVAALRIEHEDQVLSVTASFGMAVHAAPGRCELKTLLSIADESLYEAKSQGRNRCVTRHV